MIEQNYAPYRKALLDKAELVELSRIQFPYAARDTLLLWVQIICAWLVASLSESAWICVICACLVGNRYYSLFILGHDGLHRRIHANPRINDWWTDIFLIGPLGAVVHINRTNHMRHHSALNTSNDPDRYKYISRQRLSRSSFALSMTGLPFALRAIQNVYLSSTNAHCADVSQERYHLRDVLVLLGVQALLIGGLTLSFGWWGYLLMWLIPAYVFAYCADMARVFCEHSTEDGDDDTPLAKRMIMFRSNAIDSLLFAPMNMNHHVAHHLWPSIPYYNLPAATSLLHKRLPIRCPDAPHPEVRSTFTSHLINYYRRCGSTSKKTQTC